jgi:hypothetical protein
VTDPRLHSTKPIDDEVPFEDADEVRRDEAPQEEDALVTPAAAERQRMMPDRDVEPSARQADDLVEDQGEAS